MEFRITQIIKSGFLATATMTTFMLLAPIIGMPEMSIGKMLAGYFGLHQVIGWLIHLFIGIMLAGIYMSFFHDKLPSNNLVKGLQFSMIPFLIFQLIIMPMMQNGVFSTNTGSPLLMIIESFIGHISYGTILGLTTKSKVYRIIHTCNI